MLFNSYLFLLAFLPIAVIGYRLLYARGQAVRIAWLLSMSLVFFAANDLVHLPLLLGSIIVNFFAGYRIAIQPPGRARRLLLAAAVTANVGLLVLYKYWALLAGAAGLLPDATQAATSHALPLGISFFTFTQIAFLIDCARGEVKSPRLIDYGVFVSWFPHLVAGPLLPHKQILPQLRGAETRQPDAEDFAVGLTLLVLGLFKKVVLADTLQPYAADLLAGLGAGQTHGMAAAWLGSIAFMLVIYFDFSGYSDMALGISRLFAINLPVNFYSPYRARNPSDFWRRWHRTLSWFIRTYMYSSFAGRRTGFGQYARLIGIMALVGLWHGSTWNFILFGVYQGILLSVHNFWRLRLGHRPRPNNALADFGARAANFAAMMMSAGMFYFHDVHACGRFYASMLGLAGIAHRFAFPLEGLALTAAGLAIVWFMPNSAEIVRNHLPRILLQQLPNDLAPVRLVWSTRLRWGLAMGALAAIALAAIPHTADFAYNVF